MLHYVLSLGGGVSKFVYDDLTFWQNIDRTWYWACSAGYGLSVFLIIPFMVAFIHLKGDELN